MTLQRDLMGIIKIVAAIKTTSCILAKVFNMKGMIIGLRDHLINASDFESTLSKLYRRHWSVELLVNAFGRMDVINTSTVNSDHVKSYPTQWCGSVKFFT